MKKEEIHYYLSLNNDQLYQLIGEYTSENMLNLPSPKKLIFKGKNWFESKRFEIGEAVCGNKYVKEKVFQKEMNQKENLVATLADILITSTGTSQVPPFIASVLVIRESIDLFCSRHMNNKNK